MKAVLSIKAFHQNVLLFLRAKFNASTKTKISYHTLLKNVTLCLVCDEPIKQFLIKKMRSSSYVHKSSFFIIDDITAT